MQAVSKLTNQWIDAFRAGNHGSKGQFTEADIDRIVANYKPEQHEAPVCVGHPESDAPAYGWVGALRRQGNVLQFQPRQVEPQFEEMVEAGRFKKRSASFYRDQATGQITGLRHIAFLGAQPPEVKGLADCKFEQSSTPAVEVDFQENLMTNENQDSVFASFKAWYDEKFGTKTPSTAVAFSEADVKRIAGEAVTAAVTAAVKPLQDKLDVQSTQFSERDKQLVTTETTARATAAIAKVKASGRWVPAFDKMGLGVVFSELAKATETVEFGEGDAKKKLTPLDTLVSFMESLGKIVPAGADIFSGTVTKPAAGAVKFSEADHKADHNSVTLANLAQELVTKDKISFGEAMQLVLVTRPELAIPGGATAGAV